MTIKEAIEARHAVRAYTNRPIEEEKVAALKDEIEKINKESGLRFMLFTEEPEAFKAGQPHYGSFSGCRNYFALIGKKDDDEKIGYYGERLVLFAQTLGLNTCWVAMTYEHGKVAANLSKDEKIFDVVSLGYGETEGKPHKSKPIEKLCRVSGEAPAWFYDGMKAAALAPTAINQQQFMITYDGGSVSAKALFGPCSKTDLGIVKYHFEIGAGKENVKWK